jgi:hypothetical protein
MLIEVLQERFGKDAQAFLIRALGAIRLLCATRQPARLTVAGHVPLVATVERDRSPASAWPTGVTLHQARVASCAVSATRMRGLYLAGVSRRGVHSNRPTAPRLCDPGGPPDRTWSAPIRVFGSHGRRDALRPPNTGSSHLDCDVSGHSDQHEGTAGS